MDISHVTHAHTKNNRNVYFEVPLGKRLKDFCCEKIGGCKVMAAWENVGY